MANNWDQTLERALMATVKNELQVMDSFCQQHFPLDLATTVAMRMSRAVVSSICRLNTADVSRAQTALSPEFRQFLTETEAQVVILSRHYEDRLTRLDEKDKAWSVWIA